MPDLLLELFSEEIPARLQARAAEDLKSRVQDRLFAAGYMPEGAAAFATPRRLTLVVSGLPGRSPDRKEEKKGPRVGAPDKAIEGFLKSAGLSSLDECEQREDKKGAYWVAMKEEAGRPTPEIVAEIVPAIVRDFPWPKSMRWGDGDLRWVRPLHAVLCAFEGEVVDFEIDGIKSGDATWGHRFMAPDEIRVRNFEAYETALKKAKVVLDPAERAETIHGEAKGLCEAQGLELVEDAGLLREVAGLVEWPVVLMGAFDEKFLSVPDEALTASMRGHQKYFSVRDPKTGRLANRFVFVANLEAGDGGKAMRTGYERVLTARLSDAYFLYRQDLKTPLEYRLKKLEEVTFFEGLGTMADKAKRVAALAKEIAPKVGADPALAEKAALLAKCDLVTGMVYEFPELQGLMGRYYAQEQGVDAAVADAIRDHYKPAGQDDDVPSAPVSVAVALADKIDTLTAFWAIGKKPTGSSDPFALRRAALGVIKLVLANGVRMRMPFEIQAAADWLLICGGRELPGAAAYVSDEREFRAQLFATRHDGLTLIARETPHPLANVSTELFDFILDRMEVYLRDLEHRYDCFAAIRDTEDRHYLQVDDLVLIVKKLEALEAFLASDDGGNLAAAYKRATNILKAEEKKDGAADWGAVDPAKLVEPAEKALHAALSEAELAVSRALDGTPGHDDTPSGEEAMACEDAAVAEIAAHAGDDARPGEDFAGAMSALARLRAPLDAFFDAVTVNAEDAMLRRNRLALLSRVRTACGRVADLSKLEG